MVRFSLWMITAGTLISVGCSSHNPGEREQSRRSDTPSPSPVAPAETATETVAETAAETVAETAAETVATKQPVYPEDSFEVTLPSGNNWQILQRGRLGDNRDTFAVAVADVDRSFQLTVTVLPGLKDAPTLESMKAGWEKGFLKKSTRKKSSEEITISGRPAYKVVAALDVPEVDLFEVVGILVVAEGRNFSLGITKPGENVFDDPEVRQFVDSFKIVEGRP